MKRVTRAEIRKEVARLKKIVGWYASKDGLDLLTVDQGDSDTAGVRSRLLKDLIWDGLETDGRSLASQLGSLVIGVRGEAEDRDGLDYVFLLGDYQTEPTLLDRLMGVERREKK